MTSRGVSNTSGSEQTFSFHGPHADVGAAIHVQCGQQGIARGWVNSVIAEVRNLSTHRDVTTDRFVL